MFKRYIIKATCTAMALGGIALLAGCGGLGQRPLAPGTTALQGIGGKVQSSDSPFILTFSDPSKPRLRAAKPTVVKTASRWFSYKDGGSLGVETDIDSGVGVYVKKAGFVVAGESISSDAYISMTVYSGATLQDIDVVFTPSGLKFNPPATLTLVLGGTLSATDLNGLKAYLIDPGAVTAIPCNISSNDGKWYITLKVPGFSIYSLGDNLIPETLSSLGL